MGKFTFISYARQDAEFVLKLAGDLRSAGASIWLDQFDISGGQNWDEAVEEALEACESFLLVLSPTSVKSPDVRDELSYALEENKVIIPVLYQPCKIPLRIHRRNYVDFTGSYESALKKLLSDLGVKVSPAKSTASASRVAADKRKSAASPKGTGVASRAISGQSKAGASMITLRSRPLKSLSGEEVAKMLKQHDFYCKKHDWSKQWANPGGKGVSHDYEKQSDGKVVLDKATGLMWQQSGSGRGNYKKAQSYIEKLNSQKFAGYDDWRLPTLEEAMSLMEPEEKNGDLYIDPVFDKAQRYIWTADRHSASRAWYVGFNFGFCNHFDVDVSIYVRAVRSP